MSFNTPPVSAANNSYFLPNTGAPTQNPATQITPEAPQFQLPQPPEAPQVEQPTGNPKKKSGLKKFLLAATTVAAAVAGLGYLAKSGKLGEKAKDVVDKLLGQKKVDILKNGWTKIRTIQNGELHTTIRNGEEVLQTSVERKVPCGIEKVINNLAKGTTTTTTQSITEEGRLAIEVLTKKASGEDTRKITIAAIDPETGKVGKVIRRHFLDNKKY